MLASFGTAYLTGDPRALGFVGVDFRDPISRRKVVDTRSRRPIDPALADLLMRQHAALCPSERRSRNLSLLCESPRQPIGVVVTGQQIGLFLGPLYTVYKAATAVASAQALSDQTGTPVVPLFWLQTEDHDYEEIRSCSIPGPQPGQPPLRLSLSASDPNETRSSVAYRRLGAEIEVLLSELWDHLRPLPYAEECLSLLRRHYVQGNTLAQAFSGLLAEIFSAEGLLFLDPRKEGEQTVSRLAAPLYEKTLTQHHDIMEALQNRERALRDRGFASQIPMRPSASLLFYYPDGERGSRYRLEQLQPEFPQGPRRAQTDLFWTIPRIDPSGSYRQFSQADLLAQLHTNPRCFGTSALLRPLVQDAILPTVAYVGGPAELSYFAQVLPLYDLFGIPQPIIMPRARFRLTDESTRNTLAKLRLSASDLESPRETVLHKLLQLHAADSPDADNPPTPKMLSDRLLAELLSPLSKIEAIDPALRHSVDRARRTMEKTAQKISTRYAQRLQEREAVSLERIDRIQSILFPSSTLQERVFSLPYFLARDGLVKWKQKLFSCLTTDSVFSTDQAMKDIPL